MLNIPEEVKALFSSDTVHKNFHVRFPNGECTDLNNENLISESVSFTESLCSQQYFKFGLAEASQIEFTAVGIPNIRGAYIECAIEIDCTRLGAEWAEDNPVDNTLPFLDPQTCTYEGKLYYRVPYGRFKVDECPRDHGAMWQRQITAYSDVITKSEVNPFEERKNAMMVPLVSRYTPNLYRLFCSLCNDPSIAKGASWSWNSLTISDRPSAPGSQEYQRLSIYPYYLNGSDEERSLSITVYYSRASISDLSSDRLFSIETSRDYQAEKTELVNAIKIADIDWSKTLSANGVSTEEAFYDKVLKNTCAPYFSYSYMLNGTTESLGEDVTVSIYESNTLLYPTVQTPVKPVWTGAEEINPQYIIFPRTVSLYIDGGGGIFSRSLNTEAFRYSYNETDFLSMIKLNINSTLKSKKVISLFGDKKVTCYSFSNAISLFDIMIGFLELSGLFLKPGRSGSLSFFQMSENPTAIPVPTSDWAEFWWDETPIDAIGQVKVIYTDTENNEQQQQTFTIGDGNSIYTIENNEVLKSAELDETTMQSILSTYFEPNASVINFTPVELEMRGLPYLESGDYIELTAEDGETVETYILSQTINGIQHLTASVTSTNGALLEVIEDE